jgi:hypothetical protein
MHRGPDGDEGGFEFASGFFEFVVVDAFVVGRDSVVGDVVEAAGEVGFVAVGEVAAVGEVHGEDFVSGFEDREVDSGVCLGAGVGLDVGVGCAEELFGAIDGELFDDVDVFAAAVPAFSGVTFGVFVGEEGALGLHDGGGGEVFGGDEFDVVPLAVFFCDDGLIDGGVGDGDAGAGGVADAGGVAATFEGGGEEGIGHGDGGGGVGVFAAEAQDVGVVVLAGGDGFLDGADAGGADVGVAVGGDAHTDTRGAGEDAVVEGAVGDAAGDEVGVIGVVHGFLGVRAEVLDLVTGGLEVGGDGVFQVECAVVGAEGDAKGGLAHVGMRGMGAGLNDGKGVLQTGIFLKAHGVRQDGVGKATGVCGVGREGWGRGLEVSYRRKLLLDRNCLPWGWGWRGAG